MFQISLLDSLCKIENLYKTTVYRKELKLTRLKSELHMPKTAENLYFRLCTNTLSRIR